MTTNPYRYECLKQGRAAHKNGQSEDHNPYTPGTEANIYWLAGWKNQDTCQKVALKNQEKSTFLAAVVSDMVNRMTPNPHPCDLNACVAVAVTNLNIGCTGASAYEQSRKLAVQLFKKAAA